MTFFIIFFIVLTLVHTYIGRRLINSTRFSSQFKNIFWSVLILMFLSLFLSILLRVFRIGNAVESFLGWIGYTWLGFISLIFLLILFRDLGWGIGAGINKIRKFLTKTSTLTENNSYEVNQECRQFINSPSI